MKEELSHLTISVCKSKFYKKKMFSPCNKPIAQQNESMLSLCCHDNTDCWHVSLLQPPQSWICIDSIAEVCVDKKFAGGESWHRGRRGGGCGGLGGLHAADGRDNRLPRHHSTTLINVKLLHNTKPFLFCPPTRFISRCTACCPTKRAPTRTKSCITLW